MPENSYDVVLFDLYGTLVDIDVDETADSAWTALRCALYARGADYVNNDRLREEFSRAVILANASREQGNWFEPDYLPAYETLFEQCWIDCSSQVAKDVAFAFRKAATKRIRLFDGALEMLDELRARGMKLILLSNAQACYTRPELEELGLVDKFDDIVLSSDEGLAKPSPELFRRVLRRADVPASRVLMVGNNERCDVFGAGMAGIDAVYLNTDGSSSSGEDTSDYAVCSLQGADYKGLVDFIDHHESEDGTDGTRKSYAEFKSSRM